jgi:hypothetical protein
VHLTAKADRRNVAASGLSRHLVDGVHRSLPPHFRILLSPIRCGFMNRILLRGNGQDFTSLGVKQNGLYAGRAKINTDE